MEDSNSLDEFLSDEIEQLVGGGENFNEAPINQVAAGGGESEGPPKKSRRLSSSVWVNYEILPNQPDGKERCKCKKCGVIYLCESKHGTGNLRRHLTNCKKRDTCDIGQLILQRNSSSSSSMIMSDSKYDPSVLRELVTSMIIVNDLPFQFVERSSFRAVLSYLRSDVQFISRNTARSDCKKQFLKEKKHLQLLLSKCDSRVCLTSDLWTSINTDGFICLTVHFIDSQWCLRKKIISFSFLPPPHDGSSICEKLQSLLSEWKLESKLFSITLDNASANNVAVEHLRNHLNFRNYLLCSGEYFHNRCTAHIVNLIVQEGIKEIDDSVTKIRESIKYVKGSQARKQKFSECVVQSTLDGKRGLRQDVPTRWNSTFIMLDSAIFYRRAFTYLELCDSSFKTCPTSVEWDRVEVIAAFLAPFYHITTVFSGNKYPTANLYFPLVSNAYVTLQAAAVGQYEFIRRMAIAMLAKFEKYWSEFSIILAIAVILDPRYKFTFVEWCYKKIYGTASAHQLMKVREKLFELFENYSNCIGSTSARLQINLSQQTQHSGSTSSCISNQPQFLQDFHSYESEVTAPRKSELESYLDESKLDSTMELQILEYWKGNQYRYPTVSLMARDVLCIPISTVASESAFSSSGRILDKYRSALKHDIVEALVCTKDWLYSENVANDPELETVTGNVLDTVPEGSEDVTAASVNI